MVVTGELPCSKEEAAALAGIQLRIEETWGRPHGPISPDDNTLKPISEDKATWGFSWSEERLVNYGELNSHWAPGMQNELNETFLEFRSCLKKTI
ncbi:unnamed protein product [Nezara viridula]|uniref:Uncharacterized protein n=1 Tax=Nezara viridula TaxID=85310 RepID=A0A9P0GWK8_NEZVI|nr:unnamed protein product [Nezara viridula]